MVTLHITFTVKETQIHQKHSLKCQCSLTSRLATFGRHGRCQDELYLFSFKRQLSTVLGSVELCNSANNMTTFSSSLVVVGLSKKIFFFFPCSGVGLPTTFSVKRKENMGEGGDNFLSVLASDVPYFHFKHHFCLSAELHILTPE